MSRVGNRPIVVPHKVKISVQDGVATVEGPGGKLAFRLPRGVTLSQESTELKLHPPEKLTRANRAYHGTARAVIANMVHGVSKGYEGAVEISGVGYKAEVRGQNTVRFLLGFTEPRDVQIPPSLKVAVDKSQTTVSVSGPDKQVVFQVLARMRRLKKDDPFKGKGLRYRNEVIRRKAGKAGSK